MWRKLIKRPRRTSCQSKVDAFMLPAWREQPPHRTVGCAALTAALIGFVLWR
jgi:hypothetical protein